MVGIRIGEIFLHFQLFVSLQLFVSAFSVTPVVFVFYPYTPTLVSLDLTSFLTQIFCSKIFAWLAITWVKAIFCLNHLLLITWNFKNKSIVMDITRHHVMDITRLAALQSWVQCFCRWLRTLINSFSSVQWNWGARLISSWNFLSR